MIADARKGCLPEGPRADAVPQKSDVQQVTEAIDAAPNATVTTVMTAAEREKLLRAMQKAKFGDPADLQMPPEPMPSDAQLTDGWQDLEGKMTA